MNIRYEIAKIEDAEELLKLQANCFKPYIDKYGDFESNPCYMELDRMKFNINYRFGKYYKFMDGDKIIGGLFAFELEENCYKVAQLYVLDEYRNLGISTKALKLLEDSLPNVNRWVADTIASENDNVKFYLNNGYSIIDFDEENDVKFAIFLKR